MHNRDSEAARSYHEATKHSESRLRRNRHFLDFENQPIPFKLYPSLEPIPLVRDFPALEFSALDAISAGGAESAPLDEECVPDLSALSRLLYLSAGITKRKRHPRGEIYFRAYPNTGALYHIDVYLVCGDLAGLSAGVYHFGPHDFALRRLREGDYRVMLANVSGAEGRIAQAPVTLVTASTYWRNAWKYQARTYRHCFWDAIPRARARSPSFRWDTREAFPRPRPRLRSFASRQSRSHEARSTTPRSASSRSPRRSRAAQKPPPGAGRR
jgi:hypothetical protein